MSKLQNEKIVLAQLLDQKITETPEEFYEKFTIFMKQKQHEALCNYLKTCGLNDEEIKEYSQNVVKKKKKGVNAQNQLIPGTKDSKLSLILSKYFKERLKELKEIKIRPEISYNFILKIVNHCFSNTHDGKPQMELWVPSVIQYLIDNEMLTNNTIEGGLIKRLMERNAWELLEIALIKLIDISEKELVNLLKYFISYSRTSESSTISKKSKLSKWLSLIITAPSDGYLMRVHLRTLDEEELAIVLQMLCHWIEKYNKSMIFTKNTNDVKNGRDEPNKSLKLNNIPEIHYITNFLSIIFDMHLNSLIISDNFHLILSQLNNLVTEELDFFEALESLRPCLEQYHKKYLDRKLSLNDESIPDYSVEVFTFY